MRVKNKAMLTPWVQNPRLLHQSKKGLISLKKQAEKLIELRDNTFLQTHIIFRILITQLLLALKGRYQLQAYNMPLSEKKVADNWKKAAQEYGCVFEHPYQIDVGGEAYDYFGRITNASKQGIVVIQLIDEPDFLVSKELADAATKAGFFFPP